MPLRVPIDKNDRDVATCGHAGDIAISGAPAGARLNESPAG